jgi:hypothetical protein
MHHIRLEGVDRLSQLPRPCKRQPACDVDGISRHSQTYGKLLQIPAGGRSETDLDISERQQLQ